MVYSGKIYETDGANPIAVHEAEAVRPLIPIPHAPSLRIFRTDLFDSADFEASEPRFFYGNPGCLAGASQLIYAPEDIPLGALPLMAAVIVADAYQVDVEDADDLVLGYTMLNMLVSSHDLRLDQSACAIGRSHDVGGVAGPVITTPDELEDAIQTAEFGRRYALATVLRVNGVERAWGSTAGLPFTLAQAISFASQTCTLKTGDIFAVGPVVDRDDELDTIVVEPGDEVTLAVEKLGALSLKLSPSQ